MVPPIVNHNVGGERETRQTHMNIQLLSLVCALMGKNRQQERQ